MNGYKRRVLSFIFHPVENVTSFPVVTGSTSTKKQGDFGIFTGCNINNSLRFDRPANKGTPRCFSFARQNLRSPGFTRDRRFDGKLNVPSNV